MTKIKITDSENNIQLNDIIEIQRKFDITFPPSLVKLLLKYNGGVVEKIDYIDQLLSVKFGEVTYDEIINDNQILEKNIPIKYLPFAITGVGHIITIDTSSVSNNEIFLFRYDTLEPQKIANSLEELFGVKSIEEL